MITKKSIRQNSASARWSIRLAIFALALMAVSTLLHRFGQVGTGQFLALLAIGASLAALGLVLSLIGLAGLWRHGHAGGRRAAIAFALSSLALSPFAFAVFKGAALPRIADISTDLGDPPQFASAVKSGINPQLQAAAYPEITGRRYGIARENLVALVERQVSDNGWRLIERRSGANNAGEFLLEAEATTMIAGFKDRVVIRVTDEGATSFVDMRSKSEFGNYDMGANAARIAGFLRALDVLAVAGGAQAAK